MRSSCSPVHSLISTASAKTVTNEASSSRQTSSPVSRSNATVIRRPGHESSSSSREEMTTRSPATPISAPKRSAGSSQTVASSATSRSRSPLRTSVPCSTGATAPESSSSRCDHSGSPS